MKREIFRLTWMALAAGRIGRGVNHPDVPGAAEAVAELIRLGEDPGEADNAVAFAMRDGQWPCRDHYVAYGGGQFTVGPIVPVTEKMDLLKTESCDVDLTPQVWADPKSMSRGFPPLTAAQYREMLAPGVPARETRLVIEVRYPGQPWIPFYDVIDTGAIDEDLARDAFDGMQAGWADSGAEGRLIRRTAIITDVTLTGPAAVAAGQDAGTWVTRSRLAAVLDNLAAEQGLDLPPAGPLAGQMLAALQEPETP